MKALLIIIIILLLEYQAGKRLDVAEAKSVTEVDLSGNIEQPLNGNAPNSFQFRIENGPSLSRITNRTKEKRKAPRFNKRSPLVSKKKCMIKQSKKIAEKSGIFHKKMKDHRQYLALTYIQFESNNFDHVSSNDFKNIMVYADLLIFDSSLKVSIAGFTDNMGSEECNKCISLRRALNLQHYLLELGVSEKQIQLSANGMSYPIASNHTRQGRQMNRRVELALFK